MDVSNPYPEPQSVGEPPAVPSGGAADIPMATAVEPAPSPEARPAPSPLPLPAPLTYEKPTGDLGLEPYVLEGSVRQHVFLPLALVCLGTAMLYGGAAWRVGTGDDFVRLASRHSHDVVLSLLGSVGACVWCARALDVTFGLLTPAVTKLAAILVLPMGAASLIAAALGGGGGAVALGLLASVPAMWLLFLSLFKMDGREAILCCNALTVVRMVSILVARPF